MFAMQVDENTRSSLYKLRQTWVEILPNKQLYNLDMEVKKIDSNWPITAKPPSQNIHVNPKFLKVIKECCLGVIHISADARYRGRWKMLSA